MVPERGAFAGASDAGSNGDKRSAPFTIGGFWRGCENIGGISGAYRGAYRGRIVGRIGIGRPSASRNGP
ncbi:hypothetical protein DF038_05965 [Burkholderia cepacia]|nr:hypothetical protein DF038_05965 [Burkholderia cepacia]